LFLTVTKPYTDLRREPSDPVHPVGRDDLRETQLLYNEMLEMKEERGDWYFVEAFEQRKYTPGRGWHGYPGWVRKDAVRATDHLPEYNCMVKRPGVLVRRSPEGTGKAVTTVPPGTRLITAGHPTTGYYPVAMALGTEAWIDAASVLLRSPHPADEKLRRDLVDTSLLLIGTPYLWGGRSGVPDGPAGAFGVDCSGLTNLIFRVNEIDIPRNAHDQWLAAGNRGTDGLLPGDLIFLSREGEEPIITHVMLSLGGDEFIEAPETGSAVKITTFQEKFGLHLRQITEAGFSVGPIRVRFGSILALS
jgi:gamma-D-glutamyl-L-lysine dipeptidyl-peptidase